MERDTGNLHELSVEEAAAILGLPVVAVAGLAVAGFLEPSAIDRTNGHPFFAMSDVKAFQARNADNGSGFLAFNGESKADPQELLAALDGESEDMARRAFDIFAQVFPEAKRWGLREQQRFITQARSRFEAILAVTGSGAEVDEALVGDLQDVGADAAWSGSSLPQLLVVLRISRDLVVQTAVELAEARGGRWGLALSLLLTRILPAVDRLTDSLAQGYWAAMIGKEEDARARYQHVVEASDNGIFEVDIDGHLTYANPALERLLGRSFGDMAGEHITDVLRALGPSAGASALLGPEPSRAQLDVARGDGVPRIIDVRIVPRFTDSTLVGHQGVVRDITSATNLERDKNEFLQLITYDLRQPLTAVLGMAATIESHIGELPVEQVVRIAGQIRRQAERMSRLADDLHDVSRLEAQTLLLNTRPVQLLAAAEAAVIAVADDRHGDIVLEIPGDLDVVADARRLEQVLANLVENALVHGAPPVRLALGGVDASGRVVVTVSDAGPGVPESLQPTLFDGVRTLGRSSRDKGRGSGLGLALVRGLTEAMGGRVWYDTIDRRSTFCLALVPARQS
jgi:PAS domain S-box-containing protein